MDMSEHGGSFKLLVIVRKPNIFNLLPLISKLRDLLLVHFDFWRSKSHSFHKVEIEISGQSSQNPEEGFFILVVWLGRNVKILKVSFSVEGNLSGFDFSVFLVDFVPHQHNRNILADSRQIFVPLGDTGVGDSAGDIKHENSSMGSDIITFSETTQFFLTCSVPKVKLDWSMIRVESDRAHLDTRSRSVFFLKLTCLVSLDKGWLSHSSISDQDDFELSDWLWFLC